MCPPSLTESLSPDWDKPESPPRAKPFLSPGSWEPPQCSHGALDYRVQLIRCVSVVARGWGRAGMSEVSGQAALQGKQLLQQSRLPEHLSANPAATSEAGWSRTDS